MGGLHINFAEVESTFEALPEDVYEVIVEDATVRESNSSDNDYINWVFKVTEGDHEDRLIFIGTSFSPNALFGLKNVLVAIGAIEEDDEVDVEWDDAVDITPREGPQVTNPDVLGLPARIQTVNSMWDNRERQDAWRSEVLPAEGDATPAKKTTPAKGGAKKGATRKGGSSRSRKGSSGGRQRKLR